MIPMRKRAFKGTISLLILLSLSIIFINVVTNGHIHRIADGTILFHAHPYQKSSQQEPVKNHHHTRFELFFYDLIKHLLEFGLFNLIVWLLIFAAEFFKVVLLLNAPSKKFIFIPLVRAPPAKYPRNTTQLLFI